MRHTPKKLFSPTNLCLFLLVLAVGATTVLLRLHFQAKPDIKIQSKTIPLPVASTETQALFHSLVASIARQRGLTTLQVNANLSLSKLTMDPTYAREAVLSALRTKQLSLAIKPAIFWANIEPKSLEAQQYAASLLVLAGRDKQALLYLKRVMSLTDDPREPYELGKVLQQKPLSLQNLKTLRQSLSSSPDSLRNVAALALTQKQITFAITILNVLKQATPGDVITNLWYARALAMNNEQTKSIDWLKQQALIFPKHANHYQMLRADILSQQGSLKAAQKQYQSLVNDEQLAPQALMMLAKIHINLREWPQAKKRLLQLHQYELYKDRSAFLLGEIYAQEQKFRDAVKWYEQVSSPPLIHDARVKMAKLLYHLGETENAVHALDLGLITNVEQAHDFFLLRAQILFEVKLYNRALAELNRGLQTIPHDTDLLYLHAGVAKTLQRYDIVEKDLRLILKNNPKEVNALNFLGYFLTTHLHRYDEAQHYLKQALALAPENPAVLDSMGWLEYHKGNYEKALYYLKAAYQLDNDPEIAMHLAETLWRYGDKMQAEKIMSKVLQQTPDNKVLLKQVNRIKLLQ